MRRSLTAFLLTILAVLAAAGPALAQTASFTYQGELRDGGVPVTGAYDVRLTIYTAAAGGTPASPTYCADDVAVENGRFTVVVPQALPTSGASSFLEVSVRPGAQGDCASATGYTTLAPRQAITPAPSATYAQAVAGSAPAIEGAIRWNRARGRLELFDGAFWNMIAPINANTQAFPDQNQNFSTAGTHTFTVPEGVTRVIALVWGAGGGGGWRGPGSTTFPASCQTGFGTYATGGGGGGGGALGYAAIPVTPGEQLTLIVGAGGAAATSTVTTGGAGGASRVQRGGADLMVVAGGAGGQRLNSVVTIQPSQEPGCTLNEGHLGGPGGAGGTGASLLGAGTMLAAQPGTVGRTGRGPTCEPTASFCAAPGGTGGTGVEVFIAGNTGGIGGNGAGGTTAPTSGTAGRVQIFWD